MPSATTPSLKPNLVANRRERLANDLLVGAGPVGFRGVEESDTALESCAEQLDGFGTLQRRAEGVVEAHAAEAEGRHFQVAVAEFALLHVASVIDGFVQVSEPPLRKQ